MMKKRFTVVLSGALIAGLMALATSAGAWWGSGWGPWGGGPWYGGYPGYGWGGYPGYGWGGYPAVVQPTAPATSEK